MIRPLQLRVYEKQQLVYSETVVGTTELGRQGEGEDAAYFKKRDAGRWRVVIARLDEATVSRKLMLVEPLPESKIRLKNLSEKLPVRLPDGSELKPGASCELALPAILTVGKKTLRIQAVDPDQASLHSLGEATVPPGHFAAAPRLSSLVLPAQTGVEPEALVRWLQATLGVLQSAASTSDFFGKAARAVVDLVGLDSGRVLLLEQGEWKVQALQGSQIVVDPGWQPSRQVLQSILNDKRTCWQVPEAGQAGASLVGVQAVVAAPILDGQGEVIGVLYGDRRSVSAAAHPITKLEAMLVEVLASGVAAGLARLEQEEAALRAQVQFEQFFTPELSRQLAAQPDLLQGRDAEVTILFCDLRRFSHFSERLGPARTMEWISDIMGALSECVLAHQGVLVDYIGDELMAMWGAPEARPDHPELACRAALDMLAQLPKFNERWQPILNAPMDLGIGLNTGVARVGNTGTQRKFKYGPLGNPVNLASRVQGATKYLKSNLLITGSVHSRVAERFASRRLCRARVVNIAEPVELYELVGPEKPGWSALKPAYEEALDKFEAGDFRPAARILGQLLTEHPYDGPALVLMSRVINGLVSEGDADPVWELPGK